MTICCTRMTFRGVMTADSLITGCGSTTILTLVVGGVRGLTHGLTGSRWNGGALSQTIPVATTVNARRSLSTSTLPNCLLASFVCGCLLLCGGLSRFAMACRCQTVSIAMTRPSSGAGSVPTGYQSFSAREQRKRQPYFLTAMWRLVYRASLLGCAQYGMSLVRCWSVI